MIDSFEAIAANAPERTCFTFVDGDGAATSYTYGSIQGAAWSMALTLDGPVAVDMANGPEFIILLLAAAYRGVPLVALNHRLNDPEKQHRLAALGAVGVTVTQVLDGAMARELIASSNESSSDPVDKPRRLAASGDHPAVILFTTGTTGPSKAVPLTWDNLIGAARAANEHLPHAKPLRWQAALPLYHVGGLEIVIRSLLAGRPFILYERFDAERILKDAVAENATHLSVVDKTLQDLLAAEATLNTGALAGYDCVLLGGGPLNPATVERAQAAGVSVYASYGMTETASLIAASPADAAFDGRLALLPGYVAQAIHPDETGVGELTVRGPGVTDGYLNTVTPRTPNGFLITGDRARVGEGFITIVGRADDLIISGGENITPYEVERALLAHPKVADAFVFGIHDATWGKKPAAIVEGPPTLTAHELRDHVQSRLSNIHKLKHILRVERLPRQGIGKPDRARLLEIYAGRLEVVEGHLYRLRLPLRKPIHTARHTLTDREVLVVELIDHEGRYGYGECDAFATDWYLPELLPDDFRVIRTVVRPLMHTEAFTHPRDVAAELAAMPDLAPYPQARSAVECAYWDLYGQLTGRPLWQLLQETYASGGGNPIGDDAVAETRSTRYVPSGTAIGIGDRRHVIEEARACVEAGYRRIKLKVAPGSSLRTVQALREAFPDLMITVDANQSFTDDDLDELRAYDTLRLGWIEEPLAPKPGTDHFARLNRLQMELATPISLDESWQTLADAERALAYPALRSFALKPAKLGGITATLDFIGKAAAHSCQLWIGGLFETGIARRMNAAFETLAAIDAPGDIGEPLRYLTRDIALPAYRIDDGFVPLSAEAGLGCWLDHQALDEVAVQTVDL